MERKHYQRLLLSTATAGLLLLAPRPVHSQTSVSNYPERAQEGLIEMFSDGVARGLPMRTSQEAIEAVALRQRLALTTGEGIRPESPLEIMLQTTRLSESDNGLGGSQWWNEDENIDLGNFIIATSPWLVSLDDGQEYIPTFSNVKNNFGFRTREGSYEAYQKTTDRIMLALQDHRLVRAVIELDTRDKGAIGKIQTQRLVSTLARAGVRFFIVGNEIELPYFPDRYQPAEVFDAALLISSTLRQMSIQNFQLMLPGRAFYGDERLYREFLKDMKAQARRTEVALDQVFSGVPFHYYGPVDQLRPRMRAMKQATVDEGLRKLKLEITELGDPTTDSAEALNDHQFATEFIPQIIIEATYGSRVEGLYDRFFYHTLVDSSNSQHSLARIVDGKIQPKEAYRAYALMSKLTSRLLILNRVPKDGYQDGYVVYHASRWDGISTDIYFAADKQVTVPIRPTDRVFDALGYELKDEESAGLINLQPRSRDFLAGPVRIVLN